MLNRSNLLVGGTLGIVLCLLLLYSRRNRPAPVAQPAWPAQREYASPPPVVHLDTPHLADPTHRPELPPRETTPSPYAPAYVPRSATGEPLDPFTEAPLVPTRPAPEQNLVAVDERPLPVETLRGIVRLKANESLWLLAERAYGSGLYAKAIFEHNRQRISRPDQIHEGDEIDLPELGDLAREFPALVPRSDDRFRP